MRPSRNIEWQNLIWRSKVLQTFRRLIHFYFLLYTIIYLQEVSLALMKWINISYWLDEQYWNPMVAVYKQRETVFYKFWGHKMSIYITGFPLLCYPLLWSISNKESYMDLKLNEAVFSLLSVWIPNMCQIHHEPCFFCSCQIHCFGSVSHTEEGVLCTGVTINDIQINWY